MRGNIPVHAARQVCRNLMSFYQHSGVYGWQEFNATLAPFYGIGCDRHCQAHAGALAAWEEVKSVTNDMAIIKERQGDLVWSASGHGFGAMIMQVAALDLKSRGLLFSAHSFGSPPVFNQAAANRWDALFEGDATQRTVSNQCVTLATFCF